MDACLTMYDCQTYVYVDGVTICVLYIDSFIQTTTNWRLHLFFSIEQLYLACYSLFELFALA